MKKNIVEAWICGIGSVTSGVLAMAITILCILNTFVGVYSSTVFSVMGAIIMGASIVGLFVRT